MRNGKRTVFVLITFLMFFALLPILTGAAGKIMPDQDVELTISYTDNQKPIPNAKFTLYKVADVDEYARLTVASEFEPYQASVTGLASIQEISDNSDWLALATTLKGIVQQNNLLASASGKTDADGVLSLMLKPGLYLVIGDPLKTSDSYIYTPAPFLIFLPREDREINEWDYSVSVSPKFEKDYNPPDIPDTTITRKVLKVWEDEGFETKRPSEITVQLLRNGKVYDTQILNKDNNWRYTWDDLEFGQEWNVVEKTVEGYTVSIAQNGITFVITNSYKPIPPSPPGDNPPETPEVPDVPEVPETPEVPEVPEVPDTPVIPEVPEVPEIPDTDTQFEKLPQTGVLWWPVPVLLFVGLVFVIIGVIRRRKYN